MDHWGDPWADDAVADTKPPPKDEVAPPTPTPRSSVLLNGFLDDAHWDTVGEEEGWGAKWDAGDQKSDEIAAVETEVDKLELPATVHDSAWNGPTQEENDVATPDAAEHADWDAASGGTPNDVDEETADRSVGSARSEPDTTVRTDDEPVERNAPYPEEELSTRSSISPSDISHTEPAAESPRTSIEEERDAGKPVEPVGLDNEDAATSNASSESTITGTQLEDEDEDAFAENFQSPEETVETPEAMCTSDAGLSYNPSLLSQLFPPPKHSEPSEPAEDDPIYSTSSRKAWYRLTRKQTMREFNSGGEDNNYVRVNWANSQVRVRVGKIVARWAAEDRIAGRGAGSRASFYWDTQPSKFEDKHALHRRTVSVMPTSTAAQAREQRRPSLATDVPAAFNWNSPSAAPEDLSTHTTLDASERSVPSAVTDTAGQSSGSHEEVRIPETATSGQARSLVNDTISQPSVSFPKQLQSSQSRPMSVDLTPRQPYKPEHRKTFSLISPPPQAPTVFPSSIDSAIRPTSIPPPPSVSSFVKEQPALTAINTTIDEEEDDDEEWGEMVQSPTAPTFMEPVPPESENNSASALPPPPPSNPGLNRQTSSPSTATPGSRDATPIVRLQGTVAPIAGLPKVDKYVPASVEDKPIGPRLLRKTSAQVMAERFRADSSSPLSKMSSTSFTDTIVEQADHAGEQSTSPLAGHAPRMMNEADEPTPTLTAEPSSQNSSTDPLNSENPMSQLASQASQASPGPADPWANADFAIFETAPPAPSPVGATKDPLTSAAAAAAAATAEKGTPAPLPVVPSATAAPSSQTRRKAEDETIRSILSGLPDLRYMLRP